MTIPDVNVWLAASWARHSHHRSAKAWLDAEEGDVAFCRVTQMSFLRLLTNPAITGRNVLSRVEAWNIFDKLLADPRIFFIAEPQGLESLWAAFSKRNDKNHLLWTDDYIAAFAQAADAELVTFDQALSRRYATVRTRVLS
jgi:toxin-antitoxin system PIN domain toxin